MDKSQAVPLQKPKTKFLIIPDRNKPTVNPESAKPGMKSSEPAKPVDESKSPLVKKPKPNFVITPGKSKSSFNTDPVKPPDNPPQVPPSPNLDTPKMQSQPKSAPKEEKTEIVENKGEKNTFGKESFITVRSGENYYRVSERGEIKIRRLEEESETFKYFYPDKAVVIPPEVNKIAAKYRSEYADSNIQKIYQNRKLAQESLLSQIDKFKKTGRFMEGSALTISRVTQYIESTWKREEELLTGIVKEENTEKYTDGFRQKCKTRLESLKQDKETSWTNNPVYKSQELTEWESKVKEAKELIKDLVREDFSSKEKTDKLLGFGHYALSPIYDEMIVARQNNDFKNEGKLRDLAYTIANSDKKPRERQEEILFNATSDLANQLFFSYNYVIREMITGTWSRQLADEPSDEIKASLNEMANLKGTDEERKTETERLLQMYAEISGIAKFPGKQDPVDLISRVLEEEDANSPYDNSVDRRGDEHLEKDFLNLETALNKLLEIKDPERRLEKFTIVWRSHVLVKLLALQKESLNDISSNSFAEMILNGNNRREIKGHLKRMLGERKPNPAIVNDITEQIKSQPSLKEEGINLISIIWNNNNTDPFDFSFNFSYNNESYLKAVSSSINLFLDRLNDNNSRGDTLGPLEEVLRFADVFSLARTRNKCLTLLDENAIPLVYNEMHLLEPDPFAKEKLQLFEKIKSLLSDKNSSATKERAIELLKHFPHNPETIPLLVAQLNNKTLSEKGRIACIHALARMKYFIFASEENLNAVRTANKLIINDGLRSNLSLKSVAEDYLTVFSDTNGISVNAMTYEKQSYELRDFANETGAKIYEVRKGNQNHIVYIKPGLIAGEERKIQIDGKLENVPKDMNLALDVFLKFDRLPEEHNWEIEFHRAILLRNEGKNDEFIAKLNEMINKDPKDIRPYVLLAEHYVLMSEQVKENLPQPTENYVSKALSYLELGFRNPNTLIKLNGENKSGVVGNTWVKFAEKYGNVQERKATLSRVINFFASLPTDQITSREKEMFAVNILRYAEVLNLETGNYSESLKYLKSMESRYPISAALNQPGSSYWLNIILINEKLGFTDEAKKICEQILAQIKIKESDKNYYGEFASHKRNISHYLGYLDRKANEGKWSTASGDNETQYALIKNSDGSRLSLFIKEKAEKTREITYSEKYCKQFKGIILTGNYFGDLLSDYSYSKSYESLPKELK